MKHQKLVLCLVAASLLASPVGAVPHVIKKSCQRLKAGFIVPREDNKAFYVTGTRVPAHLNSNKAIDPLKLVASAAFIKALTTFFSPTNNSGKDVSKNVLKSCGGNLGVVTLLVIADTLQEIAYYETFHHDYGNNEEANQSQPTSTEATPSLKNRIFSKFAGVPEKILPTMLRAVAGMLYVGVQNNLSPKDILKPLRTPVASAKEILTKKYTVNDLARLARFAANTLAPLQSGENLPDYSTAIAHRPMQPSLGLSNPVELPTQEMHITCENCHNKPLSNASNCGVCGH